MNSKFYSSRKGMTNLTDKRKTRQRLEAFRRKVNKRSLPIRLPISYARNEIKTVDKIFSGAYALGVYTVDQEPLQSIPINTNTNLVQCINLIQQGSGISQRIGNKVNLKSLRMRLRIVPTGVNCGQSNYARIMLLWDKQPNGTYIASNSILSDSIQNNTVSNGTLTSNINPNFFDRFVVLRDIFRALPQVEAGDVTQVDTLAPTEGSCLVIDDYVKLKEMQTIYTGTANPTLISNVTSGALLLLVLGSRAATTDPWQIQGHMRLRFYDN